MKTIFQEHWDKAKTSHPDKNRFEVIEIGWEQHVLVDHKNNVVYRYPRRKSAAEKLSDEVGLLKSLGKYEFPLKIPKMRGYGHGYASYDYIEGDVLSEENIAKLENNDFQVIGAQLGDFLSRLHKVDRKVVLGKKNQQKTTLLEYYSRRIESAKGVTEFYHAGISDLKTLENMATSPEAVVHGDLHGLNMVFNPETKKLVGIIDFSEVEIGDPNQDFRKIFMADARFLKPAISAYSDNAPGVLSEEKIKLWAYVNEWANLCHFHKHPQNATYQRAQNHLKKWGKL